MAIEGSMEMMHTHLQTRRNNDDSTGTPEIQPGTEDEEDDNSENIVHSVNFVDTVNNGNFEMVSIV